MKILTQEIPTWNYTEPAPLNTKMLLLTHGGVCVVGVWKGEVIGCNKNFRAWAGLPRRNKEVEQRLGLM